MRRQAVPTFGTGAEPHRQIGSGNLPTSLGATGTTFAAAKDEAHGVGAEDGYTTISVSAGTDITLYIYDRAQNKWVLGGGTAARQTVTYTAAAMHDWLIPPGALFYIVAGTSSRTGYTSAPKVSDIYPDPA